MSLEVIMLDIRDSVVRIGERGDVNEGTHYSVNYLTIFSELLFTFSV